MSTVYKPRTSDEALDEHLKMQKSALARKHTTTLRTTAPASGSGSGSGSATASTPSPDVMRLRTDSTATSIYVIGADNVAASAIMRGAGSTSNPATMERKQYNRTSWTNMRRKGDEFNLTAATATITAVKTVTPSPQTSRGGAGGGTASGRTTAASGRISTSGATTISGSNNTLNDIISDYHSQEAVSSDYQYSGAGSAPSPVKNNLSSNGSFNMANGSTVKLVPAQDDDSNQQTKCSVFRGLVLCICLNVTYANVVRFPRELDFYGSAYLIPYIILLFLVGLPLILLEISVGQFLGQGAAHTWRASPIFKGACIISRFASWVSTIWVSLQAVLSIAYIGMFLFNTMPFRECVGDIKIAENHYTVTGNSGQECLVKTFLMPFWDNPLYFGLLSIGLICIWIVVMLCTHNGRVLRRSIFTFGLLGFLLLCCLTGWEVHNSFERSYFPDLWPFDVKWLYESNIWFNALMQVLFATNCGFGALPMITGKFLYKGDAVRTSVVYLCFNLLINAISVTLFMVQFDLSANSGSMIDELKPLTAIYDRILFDRPDSDILVKLIPTLIYALVVISAFVTLVVAIYTATRLVPRHPNYVISLIAVVTSIIALSAPKYIVARILDARIVGTFVITALIFELIAITWIYGVKNVYTDLEFSIGRPIFKGWMGLWYFCPAVLTGLLVWWCSDDDQFDLLANYVPRWAPILLALVVIFIIACIQIFRQVEYNFFGMICEASKSAKEWGPADPLARHAWKQWRSVCQDTGRRDFTLRRRGTRDYTHSIKKGQYSNSNKFGNGQVTQPNWKTSTPGSSSPNYSGSMFGDSAIEEDISVDKFPGVSPGQPQQAQPQQAQFVPFHANDGKPLRYSNRGRAQQRTQSAHHHHQHQHQHHHQQQPLAQHHHENHNERHHQHPPPPSAITTTTEKHREIVYIRRMSDDGQHATRIQITPSNESITYGGATRNPLAKSNGHAGNHVRRSASSGVIENHRNAMISVGGAKLPPPTLNGNSDHICWRQFSVKVQEYSTEL